LTVNETYAIAIPIILILIVFEVGVAIWTNRRVYRLKDTLGTLGLLVGNVAVALLTKSAILGFYLYLYQFRLLDIHALLPIWAVWVLTFVLIDLTFYIYHRISHRSRFLWAIHMNHHSSEEMNFVVAFRQAWFGPISKVPFFLVLPILGLDPTMTAVAGVVSTFWGVFGHTKIIRSLGLLEWVLNTPSHHRVHHGTNPEYIDKNYGNLLIIWDRLFGSFAQEVAPVRFGLVKNVKTINPVTLTFMGWTSLFHDMKSATNLKEAVQYFLGPPDWQPSRPECAASEV